FFQAEDGIRDFHVTGVQTCALPILKRAGIKAYVPKPFDPKQLQEVIINFLSDNNEEIQGILQSGSADSTDEDSASTAYVENNNEIGRASCREREKKSVGDGAVKKKE